MIIMFFIIIIIIAKKSEKIKYYTMHSVYLLHDYIYMF